MVNPVDTVALPPEVEDLIAEHGGCGAALTFAGAAHYVLAAGAAPGPAFLFRTGSTDAVALEVPRAADAPPATAVWVGGTGAVGAAALARDGVLRVFAGEGVAGVRELRLAGVLADSCGADPGAACAGGGVVYVGGERLVVFGGRDSAACVDLGGGGEMLARPLMRVADVDESVASAGAAGVRASSGSGYGFGLLSVLRGALGDGRRADEEDWEAGAGEHALVGLGRGRGGAAISVQRGGAVEKWGAEVLLWSGNVCRIAADVCPSGSKSFTVLGAAVSSEDVVVALVMFSLADQPHVALVTVNGGGGEEAPTEACMYADLGTLVCDPEEVRLVLSADIAYVFLGTSGVVQWISVSRGISADMQVQGQYEVDVNTVMLGAVDFADGLPASELIVGGCTGFIEANRVLVLSAQVPAPVGRDAPFVSGAGAAALLEDGVGPEATPAVPDVASSLLWRAYLQYAREQQGAAEATLSTLLISALNSSGRPSSAILDEAVVRASEGIIDTPPGSQAGSPLSLLVDSQLEEKLHRHAPLLEMLSRSHLLAASDYSGKDRTDRLWDFLSDAARGKLVANAEKLAAAHRLRTIENLYASRGRGRHASSFKGGSTVGGSETSVALSNRTASTAMFGTVAEEDFMHEEAEVGALSIVSEALSVAGSAAMEALGIEAEVQAAVEDPEVVLYGLPSQFQRFLPTLRSCVAAVVSRAAESGIGGRGGAVVEDEDAANVSSRLRRLACRDILLASEAALAVINAANEVREEAQASYSFDITTMEVKGGWSCHPVMSRAVLNDLANAALAAAKLCRPNEARVLRKCAVAVTNGLLSSARTAHLEEQLRSGTPGGNPSKSPFKRRRLDKVDEMNSMWGAERLAMLTILREHKLDKEAFTLARKYEDFGMMLTLKCHSPDFNDFMEEAVEEHGREFAMFAFQWLEMRGEIKLLVFGCSPPAGNLSVSGTGGRGRSVGLSNCLTDYFAHQRGGVANLSWMRELASGDFASAANGLAKQAKGLNVAGKPCSLPNAKVLLSAAKLSLIAARPGDVEDDDAAESADKADVALGDEVDRRLYLLRAQSRLDPEADAVLPADELVKRFLLSAPVDSGSLAEAVVLALEALSLSDLSVTVGRELQDHVWRQCISRQSHFWIPLLAGARGSGDAELRHQLTNTALYEAACRVSLRPVDARDLVSRGVFDIEEVAAAAQGGRSLARMIQTAVELADQVPTQDLAVA